MAAVRDVQKYEFVGILTDYENYTFSKTSQRNKPENACFRFIRGQYGGHLGFWKKTATFQCY